MFKGPEMKIVFLTAHPNNNEEKPSTIEQLHKFYNNLGFIRGTLNSYRMTRETAILKLSKANPN
jgi:hypothetical protein